MTQPQGRYSLFRYNSWVAPVASVKMMRSVFGEFRTTASAIAYAVLLRVTTG